MNSGRQRYLLYVAIIFLLMAQYVANSYPWDRIFRFMGLITITGVVALAIAKRFSGSRKTP